MELILIRILDAIGIFAIIFLYNTFSWGLVMLKFWTWFVLPVFTGLPVITFYQAIGLIFFISLFKNHIPSFKKELLDVNGKSMWLFLPWLTLFFGWLVHILIN